MTKIEEYWKILSNTNDWIKYSDTKATILLTLYGVLLTIVYTNAEETLDALTKSNWILLKILFLMSFLPTVAVNLPAQIIEI